MLKKYREGVLNLTIIKRYALQLSILCFLFSCDSQSYLSAQVTVRNIEKQDYQACIAQGLDYGDWNDITTELYWRCRYNLIRVRFVTDIRSPSDVKYNALINKISEKIINNLIRSEFAALTTIDSKTEVLDNQECAKVGYDLNNNNKSIMDNYYHCREKLFLSRIGGAKTYTDVKELLLTSSWNKDYLALLQKKYDDEIDNVEEMIKRYPNCFGLGIKSDDLGKCVMANNQSKKCLNEVESAKIKKIIEGKTYCQQQAYNEFPDDYALTKDKSASEIEKLKERKKLAQNKNSKELSDEDIIAKQYLNNDQRQKNIGRQIVDDNDSEEQSKEKLYSRVDLLQLRERFIASCDKEMDNKLPDFYDQAEQDCLDIAKNWNK